jgi:hypothetical protein
MADSGRWLEHSGTLASFLSFQCISCPFHKRNFYSYQWDLFERPILGFEARTNEADDPNQPNMYEIHRPACADMACTAQSSNTVPLSYSEFSIHGKCISIPPLARTRFRIGRNGSTTKYQSQLRLLNFAISR